MLTSGVIDNVVTGLKKQLPPGLPFVLLHPSTVQCALQYGPACFGSVFSPLESLFDFHGEGGPSGTVSPLQRLGYVAIPVTDYAAGTRQTAGGATTPVFSDHWSLCLLELRSMKAQSEVKKPLTVGWEAFCFDSMGARNETVTPAAVQCVLQGLVAQFPFLSAGAALAGAHIHSSPEGFPTQQSSTGCGLYLCAALELFAQRALSWTDNRSILAEGDVDIGSLVDKPFEENYRARIGPYFR